MDDDLMRSFAQILLLAEKHQFVHPLYVTFKSPDGQERAYSFPAKGEDPTTIWSGAVRDGVVLEPGSPGFPLEVTIWEENSVTREIGRRTMRAEMEIAADGGFVVSAERVETGLRLNLKRTNPHRKVLFHILEEAEKLQFRYPLHLSLMSADGQEQMYEFPAEPSEDPSHVDWLAPDIPVMRLPISISIHGADPQRVLDVSVRYSMKSNSGFEIEVRESSDQEGAI